MLGGARVFLLAALAIAVCSVPSHESFVEHLRASRAPAAAGWTGAWSVLRDEVSIPLLAESAQYLLFRVGGYQGRSSLGCFGCWIPLPAIGIALPNPLQQCASWLCSRDSAWAPHEMFAALLVLVFCLWVVMPPSFMWRHFSTSPAALRSGRVWTLLTATLSHAQPLHLLHNLVSILTVGPQLAAQVPCRAIAELILASALLSAASSLLWASLDRSRRGASSTPSLGASGVVYALFTASALVSPNARSTFYVVEMSAKHAVVAQICVDCALALLVEGRSAETGTNVIDVAAHAGGALCGFWYARHRWGRFNGLFG